MPILNDGSMRSHQIGGTTYGFSATRIDDLGATEYTLVGLTADNSGSVCGFLPDIERCIKQVVLACHQSPRADNLMMRVTRFDNQLEEVHGFKPLSAINATDYDGCLKSGGTTALYDAAYNAIEAVTRYGGDLTDHDFGVNGIVFVITDGMDNASKVGAKQVKEALQRAVQGERLESLVSVLVGVNVQQADVSRYLHDLARDAGFTQYIELAQADAAALARLADFVAYSIALQSRALGSGALLSQMLSF